MIVTITPRPILESNGMGAIFQKKGKEMLKKCKICENLGKNLLNLKIFLKNILIVECNKLLE